MILKRSGCSPAQGHQKWPKPAEQPSATRGWTFSRFINVKTRELLWTTSVFVDYNLRLSCCFYPTPAAFMSETGRNPQRSWSQSVWVFSSIVWVHNSNPTLISLKFFCRKKQRTYPNFLETSTIPGGFLMPVSPHKSTPRQSWQKVMIASLIKIYVHLWKWNAFAIDWHQSTLL